MNRLEEAMGAAAKKFLAPAQNMRTIPPSHNGMSKTLSIQKLPGDIQNQTANP
jgi:hypothetical protein